MSVNVLFLLILEMRGRVIIIEQIFCHVGKVHTCITMSVGNYFLYFVDQDSSDIIIVTTHRKVQRRLICLIFGVEQSLRQISTLFKDNAKYL